MSLTVIVNIAPKSGKEESIKKAIEDVQAPTRDEEGCIKFDLYRDIESGHFTLIEEWTCAEALQAHFETDHVRAGLESYGELADGVDMRKYEFIG